TSHITTALGYLFWTVCAKGSSPSTIGMANTVISAMSLVAVLTATGFEPFLTRVLPGADSEERSGLCGTALVISVVVSGGAGVAGALLLPGRAQEAVGPGCSVGLTGLGGRLLVRATPGFRFRFSWIWLSRLRRGVAWDHLAMVAGRLPVLLLPILASALFPPAQVGYATIAMLISGAFSAVSAVVSNALLAHCADRPEHLRTEAGRAVRLIGA